ncbi:hypothetical protein C0J50_2341, partial [Silurus asotus]
DLLEADWTHLSSSRTSAVLDGAPLQDLEADGSHDAQQSSMAPSAKSSVPDSVAQLSSISESRPVKALRNLANSNSSSVFKAVSSTHPTSLQAPSDSSKAISSLQHSSTSQSGQPNPQPSICTFLKEDISTQDDFDDWDVDLDELDECVSHKPSDPDPDVSPAKRTRTSPSSADTPVVSSLRRFCNTTPKSALPAVQPLAVPSACRFTSPVTPGTARGTSRWQRGAVTPRAEHRALFQAVSPASVTSQQPRPLHMPVLTNHLVQLVSAASKTPQRPRSDSVRPKTRRFPGPAGALPQQISGRSLDDIVVAVPQTPAHGAVARLRTEVPNSQGNDEEEFSVGPWATMKAEMGLNERNPSCFLNSYSIVMVLRKAALRQLSKNKVPNMAVVLKSIVHTHADAKAVFRDPTGEMQGTVHRRLLEERQWELKTGAVLLLKQVGVFSPSNRNHYLNVTPNNLLRIYPPGGAVHVFSQPALDPAGLLHCQTATSEGGPVSQMELHYEEEGEEEEEDDVEQSSVSAKLMLPDNSMVESSTRPDCSADAQWDADDLDEMLGELPVESY